MLKSHLRKSNSTQRVSGTGGQQQKTNQRKQGTLPETTANSGTPIWDYKTTMGI